MLFTTTADVTAKFDAVFWCGDLNFRILNDRDHIHDAVGGLEEEGTPNYQKLVQHDELFRVMNEGRAAFHAKDPSACRCCSMQTFCSNVLNRNAIV